MSRVEELTEYFKNLDYQVEVTENNRLEVTRKEYKGFYLKVLVEDELTVLQFTINSKDFGVSFDNYTSETNIYAKFSEGNELSMRYTHPFVFLHLNTQEFPIAPITSLTMDLLTQMPVSSELLRDIKRITKEIDETLTQKGN